MKFPSNLNCDGKIFSEMGPWRGKMIVTTEDTIYREQESLTKTATTN